MEICLAYKKIFKTKKGEKQWERRTETVKREDVEDSGSLSCILSRTQALERGKKGPGMHCSHMRLITPTFQGSDTFRAHPCTAMSWMGMSQTVHGAQARSNCEWMVVLKLPRDFVCLFARAMKQSRQPGGWMLHCTEHKLGKHSLARYHVH